MGLICVWKTVATIGIALYAATIRYGKGNWYILIFSNGTFS